MDSLKLDTQTIDNELNVAEIFDNSSDLVDVFNRLCQVSIKFDAFTKSSKITKEKVLLIAPKDYMIIKKWTMIEIISKARDYAKVKALTTEEARKRPSFSFIDECTIYMPKLLSENKNITSDSVEYMLNYLGFRGVLMPGDDYKITLEESRAIQELANLVVNEPRTDLYINKHINKALSYIIYRFILNPKEIDIKIPSEYRSKSNLINCLQDIVLSLREYQDIKRHITYIFANTCGGIMTKAWKLYVTMPVKPFNYPEVLRIFGLNQLSVIKSLFKISDFSKDITKLWILLKGKSNIDDLILKWNSEASLLITSVFFEYYKMRLAAYRRLQKKSGTKSFKKGTQMVTRKLNIPELFELYNEFVLSDMSFVMAIKIKNFASKDEMESLMRAISCPQKGSYLVDIASLVLISKKVLLEISKYVKFVNQKDFDEYLSKLDE